MTDKTENERGELVRKLQELAIWMAGCGYDFTQHEHYMRNRHLMTDDIAALSAQQAGEPVAKYCGRRHSPEGTNECWAFLLCKPEFDPPEGAPLYTAPPSGVREGMLRAPWPDFLGQSIYHGDLMSHPDGTEFVAVKLGGDGDDSWSAVYCIGKNVSRLGLQIGDKGQAFVVTPRSRAAAANLPDELETVRVPVELLEEAAGRIEMCEEIISMTSLDLVRLLRAAQESDHE